MPHDRLSEQARKLSQEELLRETYVTVMKVQTVLTGLDGDNGLCGDVKRLAGQQAVTEIQLARTTRILYALIGVLTGSGIIGTSIWGVVR